MMPACAHRSRFSYGVRVDMTGQVLVVDGGMIMLG